MLLRRSSILLSSVVRGNLCVAILVLFERPVHKVPGNLNGIARDEADVVFMWLAILVEIDSMALDLSWLHCAVGFDHFALVPKSRK
jgi:hypothetical protein